MKGKEMSNFTKTEECLYGFLMGTAVLVVAMAFGLLWAFPVKWCWNATMPYLFALPVLSWGKAWCLMFLASILLKSHLIERTKK
jgi:hypothetical protein